MGRSGIRIVTRSVREVKELEPNSGALLDRKQVLEALNRAKVPVLGPEEVVNQLMGTMTEGRMVKRYPYVEVCDAYDGVFEDYPTGHVEAEEMADTECLEYQGPEIAGGTVTKDVERNPANFPDLESIVKDALGKLQFVLSNYRGGRDAIRTEE